MKQTGIFTVDEQWHIVNENIDEVINRIWRYRHNNDNFVCFECDKKLYINADNIIIVKEVEE